MADPDHLILMVEDDRLSAIVQREVLQQAGFGVFTVATGGDALDWASALPLAAVLLDVSLPDMDGAVVALHIGRMERSVGPLPVMAVTALEDRPVALDGVRLAAVWSKPIDREKTDLLRTTGGIEATGFYNDRDPLIAADVAQALGTREAALKAQLMQQATQFENFFTRSIDNETAFAAHALKSSALAMGYRTFAALLSAIERSALRTPGLLIDNKSIIAACLRQFRI